MVIAGTGRAGTTFLVKVLAGIGLDTGIEGLAYYPETRAGFEVDVSTASRLPHVVKVPHLTLAELVQSEGAQGGIEVVLLPIRDLQDAANSRRRATIASLWENVPGGVGDIWPWRLEAHLAKIVHDLMLEAASMEVLVVPIEYPRMATDGDYLSRRLQEAGLRFDRQDLERVRASNAHLEVRPTGKRRSLMMESMHALNARVVWNRRVRVPLRRAKDPAIRRAKENWWSLKDWFVSRYLG